MTTLRTQVLTLGLLLWVGAGWLILYGLPMLGRRIKLAIACSGGLDPDQMDFVRRLEQRLSPYAARHVHVSLHEMYNEARLLDIKDWRLRLVD